MVGSFSVEAQRTYVVTTDYIRKGGWCQVAEKISVDLMEIWRDGEPKMVLEVRGLREFRIRLWIAERLVAAACWVLGSEIIEYNAIEWAGLWKRAAKRERFQRRAMEAMVRQLSD